MKTIWKFPLDVTDEQTIRAPGAAKVIHVGLDPCGFMCLWAIVSPDEPMRNVVVSMRGTGHPLDGLPPGSQYVGSVVQAAFVWHVFTY